MALAAEVAAVAGRLTTPIWRAKIHKSLSKNKHLANSRYVQLATVREDGRPANRTVVFRGFLSDDDDSLTFVTDSRSRKVQEVAANPAAEVAWYFPQTREQYRIAGNLVIVDSASADSALQQARTRTWSAMSDGGRQQFGWPQPGRPRAAEDPEAWNQPAPGSQDPPLDTFCLVVLRVEEVEQLLLRSNERFRYSRDVKQDGSMAWAEESINP
ncbi:hypothetical protein PLESTB_001753700 [Pleodorina starrii]|uniref:Pyridoxamine 5'-phosphate oxidase Alr4036 family FMN-binding domain-containing protein n=1 Tax=Pleodorina starrii TaxID=330485 RepID=A0A9W6FA44_9CHLO|nr:hypothetical protein PLESTM_000595600 [Pleodorina starrii]GLC61410.1 hypothetical protein PLESTB_001753700 [Pleodorina starrii]GLC74056.1 hypothetical protein PLESTF_001455200 [Pleodorina starrii]